MATPNCARCVHRRGAISENGFHFVCGLSWQKARKCLLEKGKYFSELPRYVWRDKDVEID